MVFCTKFVFFFLNKFRIVLILGNFLLYTECLTSDYPENDTFTLLDHYKNSFGPCLGSKKSPLSKTTLAEASPKTETLDVNDLQMRT